jgi:DNA invertase Pin-like site-specific DNA recombinase
MIAAYIRVSTKEQRTDSQRAEIGKWLRANHTDMQKVIWYEDRVTGRSLDRPALRKLEEDAFDGRVDTVVCWKLDRLSRRLLDGVNLLARWCERGLKVIVITQRLELNGAVGQTIAALLLGLAEIETEYRRERQQAGIEAARLRGVYRGRQPGTTKGKPNRARQLRERGLTLAEIATALGVSSRTVARYLRSA